MARNVDDVVDPGLQSERTELAWRRTALAACVVGGVLVHSKSAFDLRIGQAAAVLILAFSALLHRAGATRYRRTVAAIREGRPVADPRRIKAVAAGTIVLHLVAWAVFLGFRFAHH